MDTQKCMKCSRTSSLHKTGLCVDCRTFICNRCNEKIRGVKVQQKTCSRCLEKEQSSKKNYKQSEARHVEHMSFFKD